MKYYEQGSYTNQYEDAFNKDLNSRFDGVRDYIVCHYKVNPRLDSDYWRANAANPNISESLKKVLHFWWNSKDFSRDMYKHNLTGSYQPKSWACLLAGYGVFPALKSSDAIASEQQHHGMKEINEFIRKCGLNFKSHNDLLAALQNKTR